MNNDYLRFLTKERLKAKEELDSAKIKLRLLLHEEIQEQKNILTNDIGILTLSRSISNYLNAIDEKKNRAAKESVKVHLEDYFGINDVKLLTVVRFYEDIRYSVKFKFAGGETCYEIEVPNFNSSYWELPHCGMASKCDTDTLLERIQYMDVKMLTVKSNGKVSICDPFADYLTDPDKFCDIFKRG